MTTTPAPRQEIIQPLADRSPAALGAANEANLRAAYRSWGIAAAPAAAALREARELGYHPGVLQSSEMGFPVYVRLGFQPCCTFRHFLWTPGAG